MSWYPSSPSSVIHNNVPGGIVVANGPTAPTDPRDIGASPWVSNPANPRYQQRTLADGTVVSRVAPNAVGFGLPPIDPVTHQVVPPDGTEQAGPPTPETLYPQPPAAEMGLPPYDAPDTSARQMPNGPLGGAQEQAAPPVPSRPATSLHGDDPRIVPEVNYKINNLNDLRSYHDYLDERLRNQIRAQEAEDGRQRRRQVDQANADQVNAAQRDLMERIATKKKAGTYKGPEPLTGEIKDPALRKRRNEQLDPPTNDPLADTPPPSPYIADYQRRMLDRKKKKVEIPFP